MNEVSSEFVPKDVWSRLDSFFEEMQELGVVYIDHGVVSKDGDHTGYFSHQEWGSVYVNEELFFEEPILNKTSEVMTNCLFWDKELKNHYLFYKRRQFINAPYGLTLFFKEKDFNTVLNVGINNYYNLTSFIFLKNNILETCFKTFNLYHIEKRENKKI